MGLPILLAALAAGVGAAPFIPPSTSLLLAPIPAGFLCLAADFRKAKIWPATIACFFFVTGLALFHLHLDPPFDSRHIRAFVGPTEISLDGRVRGVAKNTSGKTVLDLETTGINDKKIAADVHGLLRLYVGEGEVSLLPGDEVRFMTRLRSPRKFGVPGEFDMPRHLASKGIYATAFLKDASALTKIASRQPPSSVIGRWRSSIEGLVEESVPPSLAPLVKALTTGNQKEIPQSSRRIMAEAGIAHLFAISGLHLGMVALFLYALARPVYRRSKLLLQRGPPGRYLPLAILPFLWVYLLLTGEAVSTQRAFLMACGAAILLVSARRTSPLHLLCTATILLLLANPLLLFEPAFQLSISAVSGLMILLPRWSPPLSGLHPLIRKGGMLLLATTAATITTAPVVLHHFHQFPTSTLLCNLAAVPLVGLAALPLGLAGALTTPFSPDLAGLFFQGCGLVLSAVLVITREVIGIPGMGGLVFYASPSESSALFLLVVVILLPGKERTYRRIRLLACAIAAILLFAPVKNSPELRMTALSIGQGDSIILSLGNKEHFLIDGGGLVSETFDVGERLVAPALGRLGIRTLKGVILTHGHPDHWKGLPYILRHFDVEGFWTNLDDGQIPGPLLEALTEEHIPKMPITSGWTPIDTSTSSSLMLFTSASGSDSQNNQSLSLYARLGEEGVLLTGDIEEYGVEVLLSSPPPGTVTLLKIPHHGSRKSSPERLLDAFSSQLLFVSLGKDNRYNFPHEDVVDVIRRRERTLFRTDLLDTLTFTTKGNGWRVASLTRGVLD